MKVYYHNSFPESQNRFIVLQDSLIRPYVVLFVGLVIAIIYALAKHFPILWLGFGGTFFVLIAGNFLGLAFARSNFLEIGFEGKFFYLRSAYDIAFRTKLRYYPLEYANATLEPDKMYLNYIEQTVKLKREDWEAWNEIWMSLNQRFDEPVSIA
jgi:hypothetical protein